MNPIEQKRVMEKYFTAKNYVLLISVLLGYYILRGYYDVAFMLFVLAIIFIQIKGKYKRKMLEPEEEEQ